MAGGKDEDNMTVSKRLAGALGMDPQDSIKFEHWRPVVQDPEKLKSAFSSVADALKVCTSKDRIVRSWPGRHGAGRRMSLKPKEISKILEDLRIVEQVTNRYQKTYKESR